MKVFIFASNSTGFHGAGSAGFALRGQSANTWRTCPIMAQARQHGPGFKGLFAVFGQARGFQQGTKGASYAIQTVTRPGARRSMSIDDIEAQVDTLIQFMQQHPDWEFCLTRIGAGYAGYDADEISHVWDKVLEEPNSRWAKQAPTTKSNRK